MLRVRSAVLLVLLSIHPTACGSAGSSGSSGPWADASLEAAAAPDGFEAAIPEAGVDSPDGSGEAGAVESGLDAPAQESGTPLGEEGPEPTATCAPAVPDSPAGKRDITFIAVADVHVTMPGDQPQCLLLGSQWKDDQNARLIEALNSIEQHSWKAPAGAGFTYSLEGDAFQGIRGVLIPGDLTNNGSEPLPGKSPDCTEWTLFRQWFGLCGGDGALAYPVYEGYGNHDFPLVAAPDPHHHPVVDMVHRRNRWRAGSCESGNCARFRFDAQAADASGHYAFRWDDVWFVQLNLKPANGIIDLACDNAQCAGDVRTTVPHNPEGFLDALLEAMPKNASRQLVLSSHYGADAYPQKTHLPDQSLNHLCNTLAAQVVGGKLYEKRPVLAWISGHTHKAFEAGEFVCPSQPQIKIPWYSPGTARYGSDPGGRIRFSVFHLGESLVEVQSIGVDPANPTGAWESMEGRQEPELAPP